MRGLISRAAVTLVLLGALGASPAPGQGAPSPEIDALRQELRRLQDRLQRGSAHEPSPSRSTGAREHRKPVRITMEKLHRSGGTPPGWRFTLPSGDSNAGRKAFEKLECFKCHAIKGEHFPHAAKEAGDVGPELTGMGSHHPAEYFAESIWDPNAVIVTGPGHAGPDGLSKMPDYRDSLTVKELIDLVAFLRSLTGGEGHDHQGTAAGDREQAVGDYRVRIAYQEHAAHGTHDGAGKAPHAHPATAGHLMVFVTDAKSGEPVPYLPVTAAIHAGGKEPRSAKLAPMVGAKGFHYGANLTLPASTTRVMVRIGPTTMHVMPSAAGRFASPVSVGFDWKP